MSKIPRGQTPERKAYMKAWNAANPRDRSAWRIANAATLKAKNKAYQEANRERIAATKAARYLATRVERLAYVKAWMQANRDRVKAYHQEYEKQNREKVRQWTATTGARRRARKAGNGGSHTADERLAKFAALGNACYYCGAGGKMQVDHDVPIAKGGSDNIENILPACATCNQRKHKSTSAEFLARIGAERTNHTQSGVTDKDAR